MDSLFSNQYIRAQYVMLNVNWLTGDHLHKVLPFNPARQWGWDSNLQPYRGALLLRCGGWVKRAYRCFIDGGCNSCGFEFWHGMGRWHHHVSRHWGAAWRVLGTVALLAHGILTRWRHHGTGIGTQHFFIAWFDSVWADGLMVSAIYHRLWITHVKQFTTLSPDTGQTTLHFHPPTDT